MVNHVKHVQNQLQLLNVLHAVLEFAQVALLIISYLREIVIFVVALMTDVRLAHQVLALHAQLI